MKRVEVEDCLHGVSIGAIRDAWDEEYKLEREGQRSSVSASCSCCMGPAYGSWTCPTCSVTGATGG